MHFVSFFLGDGLLALNVALGSIVLGFAAFIVALLGRRDALSMRHAFLCVALTMTLTSPLAIWIASSHGIGIVSFALGSTDRRERLDQDLLAPRTDGDERGAVQRHSLLEAPISLDEATTKIKGIHGPIDQGAKRAAPGARFRVTLRGFRGSGVAWAMVGSHRACRGSICRSLGRRGVVAHATAHPRIGSSSPTATLASPRSRSAACYRRAASTFHDRTNAICACLRVAAGPGSPDIRLVAVRDRDARGFSEFT